MYAKISIVSILFLLLMRQNNALIQTSSESVIIEQEENINETKTVDEKELEYLARIVYAEGSVSKEDYYGIAHVVMVRAKYKNKSVIEIISDKKQFNGYKTKKWFETPPKEAYMAAELALRDKLWEIYPYNMYYFHNPKTATNKKWVRYISKYSLGMIGDHEFFYEKKIIN